VRVMGSQEVQLRCPTCGHALESSAAGRSVETMPTPAASTRTGAHPEAANAARSAT